MPVHWETPGIPGELSGIIHRYTAHKLLSHHQPRNRGDPCHLPAITLRPSLLRSLHHLPTVAMTPKLFVVYCYDANAICLM